MRSGDSHPTPQVHRVPVIVDEFVKRGGNSEELANLNQDLRQRYGADLSSVAWRWWVHVSLICCNEMLCVHSRPSALCARTCSSCVHAETCASTTYPDPEANDLYSFSRVLTLDFRAQIETWFHSIATPIKRHGANSIALLFTARSVRVNSVRHQIQERG